jgi:protein TonB
MNASSILALISLIAIPTVAFASYADSPAKTDATPSASKPVSTLKMIPPIYPKNQRQKGIGGKVLIEAMVDATGKVTSAKVIESPDPAFSESALKAVHQWVFNPATKDGQPISSKVQIPISFKSVPPTPKKAAPTN